MPLMAQIIFYEKPGCINNTRQKKMLRQAGHTVIAKDLLTEDWASDPQTLREFFGDRPVADWFNKSAPVIKQGLFDPVSVNADQAIQLMLADPLLIRRPLMQVDNEKMAGFDEEIVNDWVGLNQQISHVNLESCPRVSMQSCEHE